MSGSLTVLRAYARRIPWASGGGCSSRSILRRRDGESVEPDWVLRDVTFALEPGETVAVVGHTGAGKTTLISLLMRFYDVQQGAIRIDGVDIKEMDLNDLRRRFGVVLQDPFLFTGTVGGNIRLGTDWIQDEDVEQAAEDVNLADFIRTLPGGFKEEVRERGSTLSTGQKQLISFARALAHDPKILILDEATSSVDTETEFRVRDALNRMVEGRTSLIIAHRLSTIQRADKIIVMHKGQVREMGTHQQLLAQRGIYYKLYQLQYKDQEMPVSPAARPKSLPARTTDSTFASIRPVKQRTFIPAARDVGATMSPVQILISAGEASGEMYGAQLIEALRRRDPDARVLRRGRRAHAGRRLRDRGRGQGSCRRRHHRDSQPSSENLRPVPRTDCRSGPAAARRRHRDRFARFQLAGGAADAQARHSGRLLRCPQFWAWRQGRVRLLRKYVNKALVIFPFEEKFYRERGVDATFVGHPLADLPSPTVTRAAYAAQYKLDSAKQWITLMPGSRVKEVRMNLPTMLDAATLLGAGYEFLLPVAPTLDRHLLEERTCGRGITLVSEALPALYHSRAAIVASGTATVEAAMMSTPFVMVYRVSALTYTLGKPRIKVPYFAMVNLIAGEKVVPELVQDNFTAERVVARIKEILPEGPARATMLEGLARVKTRLRSPDSGDARPAAERAADAVLETLRHRT